jgi:hypothetical protein
METLGGVKSSEASHAFKHRRAPSARSEPSIARRLKSRETAAEDTSIDCLLRAACCIVLRAVVTRLSVDYSKRGAVEIRRWLG